jgi:hypothetical protein
MPKAPAFIVDETGKRTRVILDIEEDERLLEDLEELEDIRAFDEAKAEGGAVVPFEKYRDERLKGRK